MFVSSSPQRRMRGTAKTGFIKKHSLAVAP
jgi:hypothetical protein